MSLPASSSLDDLLAALGPDGRGLHFETSLDVPLPVTVERMSESGNLEQGGENWIKQETETKLDLDAGVPLPQHNLLQDTLRLQAGTMMAAAGGGPGGAAPLAPQPVPPMVVQATGLTEQQIEFAALLRGAGLTGLSVDDIRHLYSVSEAYAMQAAAQGMPLPTLHPCPPAMVPVSPSAVGAPQPGVLPGGATAVAAGWDPATGLGAVGGMSATHQQQYQDSGPASSSIATGSEAPGATAPAPKRRGRRPFDTSTLTAKQLRAREAQKRFRDKQKQRMAATEASVAELAQELEGVNLTRAAALKKQALLERLLEHKDQQVAALETAARAEDRGPVITHAGLGVMHVIRERTVPGIYEPEVLMRYNPGGYRDNVDKEGRVREPPPMEKVCEDMKEIVQGLGRTLEAARNAAVGPGSPGSKPSSPVTKGPASSTGGSIGEIGRVGGPASMTAPPAAVFTELPVGSGEEALQASSGTDAVTGVGTQSTASSAVSESSGVACGGGAATRDSGASSSGEDTPLHVDTTDPGSAGLWDTLASTLVEATGPGRGRTMLGPGVGPGAGSGRSSAPGAATTPGRAAGGALRTKEMQLALREGVVVHHGPDTYYFSRDEFRRAGMLLRRMGLLAWQQAVLFPDNAMKLQAVRVDTGEIGAAESQDVGVWRGILRRLCLRPEQLRGIVAAHREFLVQEQEILHRRAELLAALRDPQFRTARVLPQVYYVPHVTSAVEATQGLMQGIQAEHVASCAFQAALIRQLDFPVQKALLFVLAWPYYPQANIIGTCAAMELGMSLEEYASMPLPPLPAHGFFASGNGGEDLPPAPRADSEDGDDALLMRTDLHCQH